VLRQIPNRLLTFEQIGLPEMCRELIRRPRGLFLITGPTGSGKTTSLATMIDYINTTMDHHIITMEDPIEYYHKHKKSILNQREVGNDVPSFAEALRRALRQDPDNILVGEMRDLETIEAAIRAAETGHLVFATLHTTGAAKTIDRVVDAFPVSQQNQIRVQLSTALIAVISQALLSRIDQPGMVAAYEFMVVTPAIANLIRDAKTFRIDSMIQTGKKFGMQLLDDHLWQLYSEGKISAEEMVDRAKNPADLRDKVHKLGRTVGRVEWDEEDETA
jgi:twitching motility protein PilT